MLTRQATLVFAAVNLLTGAAIAVGVFLGLPSRWLPVDLPAAALMLMHLGTGAALLAKVPWAPRLASVTAIASLALGMGLVTSLALTASWLTGVFGPVGRGGGIILLLVAFMVLPYLVVLPAVQLFWMRSKDPAPQ